MGWGWNSEEQEGRMEGGSGARLAAGGRKPMMEGNRTETEINDYYLQMVHQLILFPLASASISAGQQSFIQRSHIIFKQSRTY